MIRQQFRHGFTLIELLVVVAIIVVLISLLMPALRSAREMAKSVKCTANMKQIGLGLIFYCEENNGLGPVGKGIEGPDGLSKSGVTLEQTVPGYFAGIGLVQCYGSVPNIAWSDYWLVGRYAPNPARGTSGRAGVGGYTHYNGRTVWTCPSDSRNGFSDRNGRMLSYAIYSYAWPARSSTQDADAVKNSYTSRLFKYSQIKGPVRTMLALDAWDYYWDYWTSLNSLTGAWTSKRPNPPANTEHNYYANRHNERTNMVFFDGHVESIGDMGKTYMARQFKVYPKREQDTDSD